MRWSATGSRKAALNDQSSVRDRLATTGIFDNLVHLRATVGERLGSRMISR